MSKLRRFIPLAIAGPLIALMGCTPEQVEKWIEWHNQDPEAAATWARDECGALCTDDWDHDGVVEPEPSADAPSSDSSDGDEPSNDSSNSTGGSVWDALAQCESGGNWNYNGGSGYDGGLQFLPSTWSAYGGSGYAWQHSREEQIRIAERVLDDVGWGAWPACSRRLGLR